MKEGSSEVIHPTDYGTHALSIAGHRLELNLLPMNPNLPEGNECKVRPMRVQKDGLLLGADLVGIMGLQLEGAPPVPRICWDNREHQFWNNLQGSFHLRNAVVNNPRVALNENGAAVTAGYDFVSDFVETQVRWLFPLEQASGVLFSWDVEIQWTNKLPRPLKGFTQFWACYHPPGENFYVNAEGDVVPCGEGAFSATRDGDTEGLLKGTPSYRHVLHYLGGRSEAWARYKVPMLISRTRDWYGGKRHIFMVDPDGCAAMVTWMNQARDCSIGPPGLVLIPEEPYTVRMRHLIADAESRRDWEKHWDAFRRDLSAS